MVSSIAGQGQLYRAAAGGHPKPPHGSLLRRLQRGSLAWRQDFVERSVDSGEQVLRSALFGMRLAPYG